MKAAVYLRVSTDKQDELAQEPDCLRLCAARQWEPVLYREVGSGAKQRPVWDRLKNDVRLGVVGAVVFWALDRTGRTRVQVAHDLGELFRFGAVVASVKDAWLDVGAGPLRDLLVQIMAWVAEGERRRLIERTKAGLARAVARGVRLGRKPVNKERLVRVRELYELQGRQVALGKRAKVSAYEVAKELGMKESTVRTYFKRWQLEESAKKGGESGSASNGEKPSMSGGGK